MDLRLLGPVEVRLGDGPVELGPRKQRAVLAMLALEVGRTVSVDAPGRGPLGRGPAGERGEDGAAVRLASAARCSNGDSGARIVTRGRGYELQLADGEVDAARAERLFEELAAARGAGALVGEALADVADEPFAAAEIRRLDDLRLRATEMAVDADLAAGRHAEVTGEFARLVARAPAA